MVYEVLEYRWVTRCSILSGKARKIMIGAPSTHWYAYDQGELIQHALPSLSPQEREFLLSGITPEEWDQAFPEEA